MIDTTRLDTMISDGRLIRCAWTGHDAEGRETACLLAALSPDVARDLSPGACSSTIMPPWMAYLTPWINDAPSATAWPGIVRRYADLARRWHVLNEAGWHRTYHDICDIIVREAMRHADNNGVLGLCERRVTGDWPNAEEWAEVATAAAAKAARDATSAMAAWVMAEKEREKSADFICTGILNAIEAHITKVERKEDGSDGKS